jgi:predicted nucleic acid-binding Zn ribbon protein
VSGSGDEGPSDSAAGASRRPDPPGAGRGSGSGRRGMERLGDLLPDAARRLGLEDELELAAAMTAWQKIVAERIPAAVGACRIVAFSQGVVTDRGGRADRGPGAAASGLRS